MGADRAGWAIDDVLIGGDDINPSLLESGFQKIDKENIGKYENHILLTSFLSCLPLNALY